MARKSIKETQDDLRKAADLSTAASSEMLQHIEGRQIAVVSALDAALTGMLETTLAVERSRTESETSRRVVVRATIVNVLVLLVCIVVVVHSHLENLQVRAQAVTLIDSGVKQNSDALSQNAQTLAQNAQVLEQNAAVLASNAAALQQLRLLLQIRQQTEGSRVFLPEPHGD